MNFLISLFFKVIIVKKRKIKKILLKGNGLIKTIRKLPSSSLTKKVVDYSLEEVSSKKSFCDHLLI